MPANTFTFRRLGGADRPAILAISAKIWDGDDYVPASLDSWLSDTEGSMLGCFAGGRLVGFSKLSFLGEGEAWLEGLRKDPEAGVRGVGRALCLETLRGLAQRKREGGKLSSVRFSTYIRNAESIALNERIGFRHIASFTVLYKDFRVGGERGPSGRIEASRAEGFDIRRPPSADEAWRRLEGSGWFRDFLVDSWKAWPAAGEETRSRFLRAAERERRAGEGSSCDLPVLLEAVDAAGETAGTILIRRDRAKRQVNVVALEAAGAAPAAALLRQAEAAAEEEGWTLIECIAPGSPAVLDLLREAGYADFDCEGDFLVYELPLALLDSVPGE